MADAASGSFFRQIPPLPVTPAVRQFVFTQWAIFVSQVNKFRKWFLAKAIKSKARTIKSKSRAMLLKISQPLPAKSSS
jgi:hypothetical protein